MSKKLLILLGTLIVVLVSLTGYIFIKVPFINHSHTGASSDQKSDSHTYLTNYTLRSLPSLPETDRIVPTGKVEEFVLEAKSKSWEILSGVKTKAMTYNGKTPGPVIRVTEGDTVKITLKNKLKIPTSIHFHGMHIPNKQDGVPPFTQMKVRPGESFTYEFIAGHAGTYMYHPHINSVEQIEKGLYGAFIIDPQDTSTYFKYDKEYTMVLAGWNIPCGTYERKSLENAKYGKEKLIMDDMDDMNSMEHSDVESSTGSKSADYNFWTINGKVFPATEKIKVKKGERVRVRIINISNLAHPMHLHGHDFRIIAEDSHPLKDPKIANTVDVSPGKTFEIDFIADNPGQWLFHCNELRHTKNDGVEFGGLMAVIEYDGTKPVEEKHSDKGEDKHSSNEMNHMDM